MPRRKDAVPAASSLRVAGLMSGTSADGATVAFVDVAANYRVRLLGHRTVSYAPAMRRRIFDLCDPGASNVETLCRMNFELGEVFAAAVIDSARECNVPLDSVDLIGSHGQTVYHIPPRGRRPGSTLQIGEPSVIAERTGITTVADFRPRDMAAGGQGAPLVPMADYLLFAEPARHIAVQNLGGIANVTFLPACGTLADVLAFDTGPGNMILDRLASRLTKGRLSYDRDGRLAAKGRPHAALLAELMRHPFLRRRPPKSTGREMFGAPFADAFAARAAKAGLGVHDTLATATAFTAASIAGAYRRFLPGPADDVLLCGGGARNPTLVAMLVRDLAPAKVVLMDSLGIPVEAKEAVSFALLAARTFRGQPGNVPAATGARRDVVLGKIVPGGR